jgi:hypothetical protein
MVPSDQNGWTLSVHELQVTISGLNHSARQGMRQKEPGEATLVAEHAIMTHAIVNENRRPSSRTGMID